MSDRLVNEGAMAIARKALAVIRPRLTDAQAGDCFGSFHGIAAAELRQFAEALGRQQRRLEPSGARSNPDGGGGR